MSILNERRRFVTISDLYEPADLGQDSKAYITRSLDATSHFETVVRDVRDVYRRITGKELKVEKKDISQQRDE